MGERWSEEHKRVVYDFLGYLNGVSDRYVLKGGTALLVCYGLDRFSEDIDLDGLSPDIIRVIEAYCAEKGFSVRVAKDTETVKRCMIHYGNAQKPLKVETSYRRKEIPAQDAALVNGVLVYKIEQLCVMKANAYANRDRIRDLYDLAFICDRYLDELSPAAVSLVRTALEYKGIERFDYIVREQQDELIDVSKLSESFLRMFDRLGLLYDNDEKDLLERRKNAPSRKNPRERGGGRER
jgi:predicted nucleotidyltransferase component of viral defense system